MNRDGERRIYVQMAPDEEALEALTNIQRDLPHQLSGRRLPEEELHVTLIHYGRARDVLAAIRGAVAISDEVYDSRLQEYIEATQALLNDDEYQLTAHGYDRFGSKHRALVARYEAPPELREIQSRAYDELIRFLGACGIASATRFAFEDPNFAHAHEFKPHITLYNGYNGPDPVTPPPDVTMRFMKLEY